MKVTSILVMAWLVIYVSLMWIGAAVYNNGVMYFAVLGYTIKMIFPFSIALIYYRFKAGLKTKGSGALKTYAGVMCVLTVISIVSSLIRGIIGYIHEGVEVSGVITDVLTLIAAILVARMCLEIRDYVDAYRFQQQLIEEADKEDLK